MTERQRNKQVHVSHPSLSPTGNFSSSSSGTSPASSTLRSSMCRHITAQKAPEMSWSWLICLSSGSPRISTSSRPQTSVRSPPSSHISGSSYTCTPLSINMQHNNRCTSLHPLLPLKVWKTFNPPTQQFLTYVTLWPWSLFDRLNKKVC